MEKEKKCVYVLCFYRFLKLQAECYCWLYDLSYFIAGVKCVSVFNRKDKQSGQTIRTVSSLAGSSKKKIVLLVS